MRLLILRDDPWLLDKLPSAFDGMACSFAPEIREVDVRFRGKARLAWIALCHLGRMLFSRFCRRVRQADVVLVSGITVVLPVLLLARMGRRFRPRGRIVITFFFLHGLGRHRWLQRVLRWLMDDPQVLLTVYSEADREYFRDTVGLRRASVEVLPYGQPEPIVFPLPDDRPEGFVFAGGYSNRDYEGLSAALAATGLPAVVVRSGRNTMPGFPPGVRALRDIDPREFNAWAAAADLVVIPLREQNGSSGQSVALTALSLGRPVLYSDTPCLREYFVPGVTGEPYAHGDNEELARKMKELWDDPERRKRLGQAGRKDYEKRFSQEAMFAGLVALIREAQGAREDRP